MLLLLLLLLKLLNNLVFFVIFSILFLKRGKKLTQHTHFFYLYTVQAALRMFVDLDLPGRFQMDYTLLCRWLISVKKNYRDVTYHNWRHAFNVAQMMFSVITATQWWKRLGEVRRKYRIVEISIIDYQYQSIIVRQEQDSNNSLKNVLRSFVK